MAKSRSKLLREWLDLLRSGRYSQVQEVLYNGEGYCCLGVAADGLFGVDWKLDEGNQWYEYTVNVDGDPYVACDNELIPFHSQALGIDKSMKDNAEREMLNGVATHIAGEEIDLFDDSGTQMREYVLIRLNDKFGFDFNQIASFVEMSGWVTEAEQEESEATVLEVTNEV